ncbi:MAG: VOC family protein [Actinomycetota bacterium]|nr:VOC family protein [Actinomycetota bacterium]
MTLEVLSSRVLLRPLDLERSLDFYGRTLSLAVYREFGAGANRGVVFFLGGGFLEVSGRSSTPAGPNLSLWLQVRDVDAVHDHLRAGGVDILQRPTDEPWGLREMWVADPDGVRIAVIQVPEDHPLRRR